MWVWVRVHGVYKREKCVTLIFGARIRFGMWWWFAKRQLWNVMCTSCCNIQWYVSVWENGFHKIHSHFLQWNVRFHWNLSAGGTFYTSIWNKNPNPFAYRLKRTRKTYLNTRERKWGKKREGKKRKTNRTTEKERTQITLGERLECGE